MPPPAADRQPSRRWASAHSSPEALPPLVLTLTEGSDTLQPACVHAHCSHTCSHTCAHAGTHTGTRTHAHAHTRVLTQARTHTHARTRSHMCAHAGMHARTRTHARTHTHARTQARTCTAPEPASSEGTAPFPLSSLHSFSLSSISLF